MPDRLRCAAGRRVGYNGTFDPQWSIQGRRVDDFILLTASPQRNSRHPGTSQRRANVRPPSFRHRRTGSNRHPIIVKGAASSPFYILALINFGYVSIRLASRTEPFRCDGVLGNARSATRCDCANDADDARRGTEAAICRIESGFVAYHALTASTTPKGLYAHRQRSRQFHDDGRGRDDVVRHMPARGAKTPRVKGPVSGDHIPRPPKTQWRLCAMRMGQKRRPVNADRYINAHGTPSTPAK